jgi:hypothetical protein
MLGMSEAPLCHIRYATHSTRRIRWDLIDTQS